MNRVDVLGVRFVAEPFAVVRQAVREKLASPNRPAEYLCPTGAHGVIEAQKDARFRKILNGAALNLADGMPIVLCARALGHARAERAFGPDIMWAILEDSAPLGARHFFYGGRPGVAAALADSVQLKIPGIIVAGSYCPPFRPLTTEEAEAVVEQINGAKVDVVWIGLSTPKQERWISDFRGRLDVKLICSVGAAFDYHTASLKRAPRWMQQSGLEWLFRLVQEPRRLWRRYLEVVPKFLFLTFLQFSGLRRFPPD